FTVRVSDAANGLATAAFSLTVNEALVATTSAATVVATESAYISTVIPFTAPIATLPYTFALYDSDNTAVATLPAGLSFSTSTGEIPRSPPTRRSSDLFTVRVSDAANGLATAAFSLTVNEALVATTSAATVA